MPPAEMSEIQERACEYARRCIEEVQRDLGDAADETLVLRLMDVFATHLLSPKAVLAKEEIEPIVDVFAPGGNLTAADVVEMLIQAKSVLRGHFELLSGLHTSLFFRFGDLSRFADRIASDLLCRAGRNVPVHGVLAPTSAGAVLGSAVARSLGVDLLYVNVDGDGRPESLRPGSSPPEGSRVLLVNDMITTGRGMQKLARIAEGASLNVAGALVFAVRGEEPEATKTTTEAAIGCRVWATAKLRLPASSADTCDLCRKEVPFYRSANLNR